jgi:hypothetical protein
MDLLSWLESCPLLGRSSQFLRFAEKSNGFGEAGTGKDVPGTQFSGDFRFQGAILRGAVA